MIRRAVLDLDREKTPTPDLARLRHLYFAPAHAGADIARLFASGSAFRWMPGGTLVGAYLAARYRALADLQVESACLRLLLKDSEKRRAAREELNEPLDHLNAYVMHAVGDKVVAKNRFDEDVELDPPMHRNHRSICKPNDEYRLPVVELLKHVTP